jgi:hypothetical protein
LALEVPRAGVRGANRSVDGGSNKIAPGDVLEQDAAGRIVAVRSAGNPPVVTRFVPGTAVSPEGSDDVRGQVDGDASIVLRRMSVVTFMRCRCSCCGGSPYRGSYAKSAGSLWNTF